MNLQATSLTALFFGFRDRKQWILSVPVSIVQGLQNEPSASVSDSFSLFTETGSDGS